MLKKRIVVCLDVKDGRTTKGVKFQNNIDIGDPVEMAAEYYRQGVDELVFYDITASAEGRALFTDILCETARTVFIPLTVGGGINTVADFDRVLCLNLLENAAKLNEEKEEKPVRNEKDVFLLLPVRTR